VLCAAAYAMFVLGFTQGWAQLLALVARVSLNSRLAVLENGGNGDGLAAYSPCPALGARFSLDAVAAATREAAHAGRRERPRRERVERARRPVVSIAVLGCCCSLRRSIY